MASRKVESREDKARELQRRTAQRMEAVGRLAGGVAHDFNNILTVIRSYTELLLEQMEQGSEAHADLLAIRGATESASRLTGQLLTFSRRQPQELSVLCLRESLGALDGMLRRLIGEDIELTMESADDLGSIEADRSQIEQIIMNLVVNARDAMPEGGKLIVEASNVTLDSPVDATGQGLVPAGAYVMLTVSDTGTGMDEETQREIFEPFFTTKGPGKGTGLGMSTVYGIVQQSGGKISVYSELGRGTTVKVYLPRVDRPSVRAVSTAATCVLGGSETILVVEDQEQVRAATARILERAGYHVLTAANASEALALAEGVDTPIHLLLTDVVMPGIGGRALAHRMSARFPEAQVVYMSGHTERAVVGHREIDAGSAFVQKPFTARGLLETVRGALDEGAAR